MVWFKVDDSLHSHVKAMRAGEAALGLWTLAGSWCAAQLTDGWIPAYAALRLTPRAAELAAELVRAGLWTPDTRDGEEGWQFHEWGEYQPTRESVTARRQADADRRARWREQRKTQASQPDSQAASQGASRRDTDRASRGVSVLPDPTRPVPKKEASEPDASRPDVDRLCNRMLERLEGNGVKAAITKAWRDDARRLLDRDGRDLEQALRLIDWTADHEFWSANIHSIPKFRKQYDRLRMQAEQRPLRAVAGNEDWRRFCEQ